MLQAALRLTPGGRPHGGRLALSRSACWPLPWVRAMQTSCPAGRPTPMTSELLSPSRSTSQKCSSQVLVAGLQLQPWLGRYPYSPSQPIDDHAELHPQRMFACCTACSWGDVHRLIGTAVKAWSAQGDCAAAGGDQAKRDLKATRGRADMVLLLRAKGFAEVLGSLDTLLPQLVTPGQEHRHPRAHACQ